jgi:hypothetical protein
MNTYAEPSDRSGRVDKLTRALERGESGSAAVCGAPQSEGGRNVDRLQHARLVSSGLGHLARRATAGGCLLLLAAAASAAAYSQEQAATGAESTEQSLQTITVTGG